MEARVLGPQTTPQLQLAEQRSTQDSAVLSVESTSFETSLFRTVPGIGSPPPVPRLLPQGADTLAVLIRQT